MTKWMLVLTLLIVAVVMTGLCLPAQAADIVVAPQPVQINGLVGSIGLGAGLYWPAIQIPKYGITIGPLVALGDEAVVGGGGLQLPIAIQAPVLDKLDFVWIGESYNWTENNWSPEAGVGFIMTLK